MSHSTNNIKLVAVDNVVKIQVWDGLWNKCKSSQSVGTLCGHTFVERQQLAVNLALVMVREGGEYDSYTGYDMIWNELPDVSIEHIGSIKRDGGIIAKVNELKAAAWQRRYA